MPEVPSSRRLSPNMVVEAIRSATRWPTDVRLVGGSASALLTPVLLAWTASVRIDLRSCSPRQRPLRRLDEVDGVVGVGNRPPRPSTWARRYGITRPAGSSAPPLMRKPDDSRLTDLLIALSVFIVAMNVQRTDVLLIRSDMVPILLIVTAGALPSPRRHRAVSAADPPAALAPGLPLSTAGSWPAPDCIRQARVSGLRRPPAVGATGAPPHRFAGRSWGQP